MRRVLVDHARERGREKRGGKWQRVTLDEELGGNGGRTVSILDIDVALSHLTDVNSRQGEIAVLHLIGGLRSEEIGESMGMSRRTVERDWKEARAFLIVKLWR